MDTERCPFYGIDCEYIPVAQKVSAYADEIERLREGLKDIVPFILEWEQFYIDENGVKHTSDIVQEIADGVRAKINAILAP